EVARSSKDAFRTSKDVRVQIHARVPSSEFASCPLASEEAEAAFRTDPDFQLLVQVHNGFDSGEARCLIAV
ncbi:MAG: hypothetical protein MHM6MM_007511, partial [Cercozoa sp. M6MM]